MIKMANVLNRTTKKYLKSVNTPDYLESEWIINPELPDCDPSEWVIEGDLVRETTQDEKDTKIAEDKAAQQIKENKKLSNDRNADTDKAESREEFIGLSDEEKLIFLYDTRL